ncbi:MAG: universal stress protein [Flaviaesturariibacter sp.]|nr:universal stress protein [Flaviaesturariibacter sp.]
MPVLLVPTDFSAPAANAIHFAAYVAGRAGAAIHLLHIFQVPQDYSAPTTGIDVGFLPATGTTIPIETMKAAADEDMKLHAQSFIDAYPGISFTVATRLGGSFTDAINEYAADIAPIGIVMGAHPLEGLDSLVGSTTISITRHLRCPVIAVPEQYTAGEASGILLAIDHEPVPNASADMLSQLARLLRAKVSVIHVKTGNEDAPPVPSSLDGPLLYTVVDDSDVTSGLLSYLQHNPVAFLAVLPHHHNLWSRLFGKQHTRELVLQLAVPVLCLPG